jgi:uncharacterized protein (DUF302 family)
VVWNRPYRSRRGRESIFCAAPPSIIQSMDLGHAPHAHTTTLAVATSMFLALVGLEMGIYLISVRGSAHSHSANDQETLMAPNTNNGILSKRSNHSVSETLDRLNHSLQAKGVTIFAIVDHSGEAEKVGLKMPPTKLVLFGSPQAGTPLMLAAPSVAIDLPPKILVSEDSQGKVGFVQQPGVPKRAARPTSRLTANIAVVETLAAQAAE